MNRKKTCKICGNRSNYITTAIGACLSCIRENPEDSKPFLNNAHQKARSIHNLPDKPPKSSGGIPCNICSNRCVINQGERGYCGLRWNDNGDLKSLSSIDKGVFYSYIDPHVTNCCAAWFCPAGTGAGFPKYSFKSGPELGYSNLAVFMYGCNFNCLYCQNSSHKNLDSVPLSRHRITNQIASNSKISCICFFGGSPEPQLPFIVEASKEALEIRKNDPLRICFEWNGCGNPALVRKAAELALKSGGNLKFDLKCYTPELSLALSGVPNNQAYKNFETIAKRYYSKREFHMLTATTLLVPGYVDSLEVNAIAKFIADLDPSIPYSLLAFHPAYLMTDLPPTSLKQAVECYKTAKKHLENVHMGNVHILGLLGYVQFKKICGEK